MGSVSDPLKTWIFIGLTSLQVFGQPPTHAIDGTTGTPIGGIGTGAAKFKASDGTFTGSFWSPCATDDFTSGSMPATMFQFYSKRGSTVLTSNKLSAVITDGRADDDAVYPVHFANLSTINGVSISLTGFCPIDFPNVDRMSYPCALYQVKVTNTLSTPVEAAVALSAGMPMVPSLVAGKGFACTERAVFASSDDPAALLSIGNDNGFFTTGQCNNSISGTVTRTAVRVSLAANQSRLVKFVYAWYRPPATQGYFGTAEGRFYYFNFFSNASAVADSGLAHFDLFRDNAVSLVTRMRASNVPDWMKNQTLVSLCNLTVNSMHAQDGRYAHTEGMWNTNGTMDQMWHARQIYAQIVPTLTWQELQYWARQQMTNPAGQIHHDLGGYGMETFTAWDDQQHIDYRPIEKWPDLNCAFIISVYEAFIATDSLERLHWIWPYVKKAGQRILEQAVYQGSMEYPYTFNGSENSYDAGGDPDPYSSSIAAVTYKVLTMLADIEGDPATRETYDTAYVKAVDSFKKRWLTNNFPQSLHLESVMAGQWLAYSLKLGEMWPQADIDYALEQLNAYYQPLANGLGGAEHTYNSWAPYMVSHYGGLLLHTGRTAKWRMLQYDWYERNFNDRNRVYNQELGTNAKVVAPVYLATNTSSYDQYISVPVVWRNYYAAVGFHRNKHTGELWLEPNMPIEMNHQMTDALIMTPEGWGSLSSTESGAAYQNQNITFKSDNPMQVTSLYVKDKIAGETHVAVDGISQTFTRTGSGYARSLKVDWSGTVGPTGIRIEVSDQPVSIREGFAAASSAPVFTRTRQGPTVRIGSAEAFRIQLFALSGSRVGSMDGFGPLDVSLGAPPGATMARGAYIACVTVDGKNVSQLFHVSRSLEAVTR